MRYAALLTLELKFDQAAGTVSYRWKADEPAFAMPIRVGTKDHWQANQADQDRLADDEDAAHQGPV